MAFYGQWAMCKGARNMGKGTVPPRTYTKEEKKGKNKKKKRKKAGERKYLAA